MKCECDKTSSLPVISPDLYHPELELPFVGHQPGECKCTNELKRYERDGKIVWLCSCCHMFDDKEIKDVNQ